MSTGRTYNPTVPVIDTAAGETDHSRPLPVFQNLANPLRVDPVGTTPQPVTLPAASPYSFLSGNSVQAAQIKGSPGKVYALHFFNNSATICYVRLYDMTGTPGTGDGANIIYRGLVPANTNGAGFVGLTPPGGLTFGTGIGIRVTAAVADNDNTALTSNTILGNVLFG